MRRSWLVCGLIAGARLAHAQTTDPVADPAGVTPPPIAPAPPTPPATPIVPTPAATAVRLPDSKPDHGAAEQRCIAHDPHCEWLLTVGDLERQSVIRVLRARGYELEPSPWGKQIGAVRIFNEDVFAEDNRFLKFFNHFHYTTRERAIADEMTFAAGEIFDLDKLEESARRLRDPLWTSVIVTVPIKSSQPGKVDVLVITRDVWSLRLNTTYAYQDGSLTNLAFTLSENNFLGNRDVVAAGFTMDQGSVAIGPLFIDKNVLGSHIDFRARVDDIFTRSNLFDQHQLHSEGTDSTITLSRPLWSLASEWAAGASFSHRYAINRQFVGTQLRTYDAPETPGDDMLPRIYEMHQWDVSAYVTRQWGTDVKQDLSLGQAIDSARPSPLGTFPGDDVQRAAFIRDVLPRSELTSVPYVEYSLYTPRYKKLRNVATFELAEDLRSGPDLDVVFGVGLKALGSDTNFERGSLASGYTLPWCHDGYARAAVAAATRLLSSRFIDNTSSLTFTVASPSNSYGRLVGQTIIATRWNDTQNAYYAIGSDSGLRGFPIGEFTGQRLFSTQVEARTRPVPVWVVRVGGVMFYDLGGAANSFQTIALHNDLGVGFRSLIPQTSRDLFRFDFAFPLDGPGRGTVKFSAGFQSAF